MIWQSSANPDELRKGAQAALESYQSTLTDNRKDLFNRFQIGGHRGQGGWGGQCWERGA